MIEIRENAFEADIPTTHSATMRETKDFEDWVKETKEAYNKLSAEELLCEYTELHDDIRDCNMTDGYSPSYEDSVRRFGIVKFLIIERLKYFDK